MMGPATGPPMAPMFILAMPAMLVFMVRRFADNRLPGENYGATDKVC